MLLIFESNNFTMIIINCFTQHCFHQKTPSKTFAVLLLLFFPIKVQNTVLEFKNGGSKWNEKDSMSLLYVMLTFIRVLIIKIIAMDIV